jgi:REP element-mobilizing transposase RayT
MKIRKPNRLPGFDYSTDNLYFITSCVHNRVCCFGEIRNKEMMINKFGEIAERQWQWLTNHYPYVFSHAFVVMPNHIHLIIEIKSVGTGRDFVGTGRDLSLRRDLSLQKIKSIPELIGAYKTTTSKQIHEAGMRNFAWQRSFYDHIIRDDEAYKNIKKYILSNPSKWNDDSFYHS